MRRGSGRGPGQGHPILVAFAKVTDGFPRCEFIRAAAGRPGALFAPLEQAVLLWFVATAHSCVSFLEEKLLIWKDGCVIFNYWSLGYVLYFFFSCFRIFLCWNLAICALTLYSLFHSPSLSFFFEILNQINLIRYLKKHLGFNVETWVFMYFVWSLSLITKLRWAWSVHSAPFFVVCLSKDARPPMVLTTAAFDVIQPWKSVKISGFFVSKRFREGEWKEEWGRDEVKGFRRDGKFGNFNVANAEWNISTDAEWILKSGSSDFFF